MSIRNTLFEMVAIAALMCPAYGQTAGLVMRDAATHQQLSANLKKVEQADPMKRMDVSSGEDPSVKNRPLDLLSQSDIICYNGVATLVPKRAVLASPLNFKDRHAATAGARILSWSEFYAINRGWITTVEVTFDEASGKLPLPEATTKRIGKSTNLIVATYLGGPISVLPVKEIAATTR